MDHRYYIQRYARYARQWLPCPLMPRLSPVPSLPWEVLRQLWQGATWAQPVKLVPPGEALSLAVENENTQEFFILYGWSLFYG